MDQGFGSQMVADKRRPRRGRRCSPTRLGVDADGDVAAQMRAKTVDEVLAAASDLAGQAEDVKRDTLLEAGGRRLQLLPEMPTELWSSGDISRCLC